MEILIEIRILFFSSIFLPEPTMSSHPHKSKASLIMERQPPDPLPTPPPYSTEFPENTSAARPGSWSLRHSNVSYDPPPPMPFSLQRLSAFYTQSMLTATTHQRSATAESLRTILTDLDLDRGTLTRVLISASFPPPPPPHHRHQAILSISSAVQESLSPYPSASPQMVFSPTSNLSPILLLRSRPLFRSLFISTLPTAAFSTLCLFYKSRHMAVVKKRAHQETKICSRSMLIYVPCGSGRRWGERGLGGVIWARCWTMGGGALGRDWA